MTECRHWLEWAVNALQTPGKVRAKALAGAGAVATQQGDYAVARHYFETSIRLWRDLGAEGTAGLAEVLHYFGYFTFDQRDYVDARAQFAESRALYQQLGDPNIPTILLGDLGMVAYHQGDYAAARAQFEESLALFQARTDESSTAEILNRLGDLARLTDDYAQAATYHENSLALFRQERSKLGSASGLHKLGYIAQHRQDYVGAKEYFTESLKLQQAEGNKQGIAECLAGLAGLAAEKEPERAVRLFGAVKAWLDGAGAPLAPAEWAEWKRDEAVARAQLDEAIFDAAWVEGKTLSLEQAVDYAMKNVK